MEKSNTSYFGFSGDSEFLKWKWDYLVDILVGEMITAIGAGTFKTVSNNSFQMVAAWAIYNHETGMAVNKNEV